MSLIETRYAQAFLQLSVQNGTLDQNETDLTAAAELYRSELDFRTFLLSPEYDIGAKKRLITTLFGDGIGRETLHFLMLLLDKSRMRHLPGISSAFSAMADVRRSTLNIAIHTAIPLEQSRIDQICEKFKSLYHSAAVKATVKTNPSLIGGIQVVVGDKVFDGTIRGKLSRLQSALNG